MKEVYPVPAEFEKTARTNEQEYFERYQKSIEQPDEYCADYLHHFLFSLQTV